MEVKVLIVAEKHWSHESKYWIFVSQAYPQCLTLRSNVNPVNFCFHFLFVGTAPCVQSHSNSMINLRGSLKRRNAFMCTTGPLLKTNVPNERIASSPAVVNGRPETVPGRSCLSSVRSIPDFEICMCLGEIACCGSKRC